MKEILRWLFNAFIPGGQKMGGERTQSGRTLDELAAFLRPENLLLKVLRYLSLRQLFVGRYHNGFYVEPPSPYVSH